jgi:predicted dehydrogenase
MSSQHACLTRRSFTTRSLALGASALGFPAILSARSPNSKLQVASIGVGGMGARTMNGVAAHDAVKIVALCDVDSERLGKAAASFPDATRHADWRELLTTRMDGIDAVTIGTPDHMHAPIAVTALRARKHVYLQKPMAVTPHECRVIAQEAAKAGVVTQLGNQGRSSIESRMTVDLIRSGAIGKIKEVIIWENKPLSWWPKNTELREGGDPVPDSLNWDLWLGVREPRPFHTGAYHPQHWRAWFGFGVGEMGDMGCHHFDITFDALKLTAPLKVRQVEGEGSSGPLWGTRRKVEMIFPGTEVTADDSVLVTWHDGDIRPDTSRIRLPKGIETVPESGSFWIGENGSIFKNYRGGRPFVLPEESFPAEKYPRGLKPQDHYLDWVDAILNDRRSCADFSHGGPLTETVLVGAIADRFPGQWLEWDHGPISFRGNDAASALTRQTYREGWEWL